MQDGRLAGAGCCHGEERSSEDLPWRAHTRQILRTSHRVYMRPKATGLRGVRWYAGAAVLADVGRPYAG